MDHYRKLEQMYHDAPCNDAVEPTLSITGGGTTEVVNDHPKQLIADGVLCDGEGNQLARGTGTFLKSDVELGPDVGYE